MSQIRWMTHAYDDDDEQNNSIVLMNEKLRCDMRSDPTLTFASTFVN